MSDDISNNQRGNSSLEELEELTNGLPANFLQQSRSVLSPQEISRQLKEIIDQIYFKDISPCENLSQSDVNKLYNEKLKELTALDVQNSENMKQKCSKGETSSDDDEIC